MNAAFIQSDQKRSKAVRLRNLGTTTLQIAWLIVAVLIIASHVIGIPLRLSDLQTRHVPVAGRTLQDLQLTNERADALEARGISLQTYSFVVVGSALFVSLTWLLIGLLIVYWKPRDWRVILVSLTLLCFATSEAEIVNVLIWYVPQLEWPYRFIQATGEALSVIIFYLLPDFRFVPKRTKYLTAIYACIITLWWLIPTLPLNIIHATYGDAYQPWTTIHVLAWHITGAMALIFRYRQNSNSADRLVIKTLTICLVATLTIGTLRYLLQWIATTIPDPFEQSVWFVVTRQFYWASLLLVPFGFFVAIRKHRLWGIDSYINHALVYLLLSGTLSMLFGLVIGLTNLALQSNLASIASPLTLIALTCIFVVIAQPLRDIIQKLVNQYMYGRRDEPYAVISALGQVLAGTLESSSVMPSIVRIIGEELRFPYVAIAIHQADDYKTVAEFGQWPADKDDIRRQDMIEFLITYQAVVLAKLTLMSRSPKELLSRSERALLTHLSQQAGPAVKAFILTDELRRSRESLVIAREDERRHIRRQLHDGLIPSLASHVLKLDSTRELVYSSPDKAQEALAGLKQQTRALMSGVRELSYELRPPSLDELGLVAALQAGTAHLLATADKIEATPSSLCASPSISVNVTSSLPDLSAAVEAAAYRISMEAVTNVIRHAQACHCMVSLDVQLMKTLGRCLCLTVEDDGVGCLNPTTPGVGLSAMRERAVELGGEFQIEFNVKTGTRVRAWLPMGVVSK